MLRLNFRQRDSHFWMGLSVGLSMFFMGLAGVIDSTILPLGLSWKVSNYWPLAHVEELPWAVFVALGGFLLLLDAWRVFRDRRIRFAIWLFMMLILWVICGFILVGSFVNYPHAVGLSAAYLALTLSYSLLFLCGSPIIGETDVRWEENAVTTNRNT